MKWAIELSEYGIRYEPRIAIKAQILAHFITKMTGPIPSYHPITWVIHVDGSSNTKGSRARVVLESNSGLTLEQSLRFKFPTSNNQAEYEACLAGLIIARELGAQLVKICSDSQLMVSQVRGEYQAKEPILQQYLQKVKEESVHF